MSSKLIQRVTNVQVAMRGVFFRTVVFLSMITVLLQLWTVQDLFQEDLTVSAVQDWVWETFAVAYPHAVLVGFIILATGQAKTNHTLSVLMEATKTREKSE